MENFKNIFYKKNPQDVDVDNGLLVAQTAQWQS
jgi:hypothetical protein